MTETEHEPAPGQHIDSGEELLDGQSITRRDFVGGTLVGAGAALLNMASPAAIKTAVAQTSPMPMTGLGPEWTGPGGIGDYARSNGNTHEVVNAAHAGIRNQQWDRALRSAIDTGESPDVVVVGCGMAGLSACWAYRKQRPSAEVLMLDQHPIFGGEAKQNEFDVDGYRLTAPQGSTGIVVPFNKAKDAGMWTHFASDLGFPDEFVYQKPSGLAKDILIPEDAWSPMHVAWERSDTGFYYENHGWVKNPWRDGFEHAPISAAVRKALVDLELFRTPPRRADWEPWLDSMTYAQFLTDVAGIGTSVLPEVLKYLNPITAAMGCGLGADVISAYSAYNFLQPGVNGYYRYQAGGADPTEDGELLIGLRLVVFLHLVNAERFAQRVEAQTGERGQSGLVLGAELWRNASRGKMQIHVEPGPASFRLSSIDVR